MTGGPPAEPDVLVVGAGPAGAVTAAILAARGRRVMLADPAGPRGPAGPAGYDVLLAGPAIRALTAAGLPAPPSARPAERVDLRFGGAAGRHLPGAGAMTCDAGELRGWLRAAAVSSGAQLVTGTVTTLSRGEPRYQATIDTAAGPAPVSAAHVVIATGAVTNAGLMPAAPPQAAGLACARRFSGARLDVPVLALAAPGSDPAARRPSPAWALPGPHGVVTVGTTRIAGPPASPAELILAAVRLLAGADKRLTALEPAGLVASQAMHSGFAPGAAARASGLLVGDAAGLVNPFTGEGLSYAVHSGLLAAQAITASPADPDAAQRRYARRLSATFVGYFETARHAARRYHLAWRILAAGADSDHPFFAKGRRAILMPEGFSSITGAGQLRLRGPDDLAIAPFLAACDEVAISTIRREWPFLARLALAGEGLGHAGLRPAILFFATLMADGSIPDARHATLGAAIELALLGSLALLGPVPPPAGGRGVDWALAATVLSGDFLLAQASRLVAENAPGISWAFADWLAELARLRAGRLDPGSGVPAAAVFGALFEFPARIGAELGGSPPETRSALRDYGRRCGHVFLHAEDFLALRGEPTRLDTTLAVMLAGRFSGLPDLLADAGPADLPGTGPTAAALAADSALRSRALTAAAAAGQAAAAGARQALPAVSPMAGRILDEFIHALARPIPERAAGDPAAEAPEILGA